MIAGVARRVRRARDVCSCAAVTSALLLAATHPAGGQSAADTTRRLQGVVRLDATFARRNALHLAAGAGIAVGTYVRVSAEAGSGIVRRAGQTHPSARADLVARFLFDPLRQFQRGVYAGGGLSARVDRGDRWRPSLLLVAGVEGSPRARRWVPAIEAGFGGGVRVGVALRAVRSRGR